MVKNVLLGIIALAVTIIAIIALLFYRSMS